MEEYSNINIQSGSTMKRIVLRTLAVLLLLLAAATIYYGIEIYRAREYTRTAIIPMIDTMRYALQLSDLTPRQRTILLKVEDPAFFEHGGVDFSTPGAGITTITQGLVKIFYFEKFKPGIAKIRQTLIAAYALDPLVSKEQQLRLFINSIYLGNNASGFQQGAHVYFGKDFSELTETEFISLVADIIAPVTFNAHDFPERNAERVRRIERLVSGAYTPKGLFDLYYGPLDEETQKNLPELSYFASYYE